MTIVDSRVPVITNADEFSIPWQTLQTIIAGRSLIDTPELQIANLDEVIPVIPGNSGDSIPICRMAGFIARRQGVGMHREGKKIVSSFLVGRVNCHLTGILSPE